MRRSSSSMTFSASSMLQLWRNSTRISVGSGPVRRRSFSRRQFALPAVVLRVLDQMSWMPPVGAESVPIRPPVMVVSSSERKDRASSCFWEAKALRRARISAVVGDVVPFLDGDFEVMPSTAFFFVGEEGPTMKEASLSEEESSLLSCLNNFSLRGDSSGFAGEWISFHVFTTCGHQKASRLGRRSGAWGMRFFFFERETSLLGLAGASGGVFRGERCREYVGELCPVSVNA